MLVLVLISIVVKTFIRLSIKIVFLSYQVLFVCCTTPAAVLSIMYSVQLKDDLGFQVLNLNHLITIIICQLVLFPCSGLQHNAVLYFSITPVVKYMIDTNAYIQKAEKLAVMSPNTVQT